MLRLLLLLAFSVTAEIVAASLGAAATAAEAKEAVGATMAEAKEAAPAASGAENQSSFLDDVGGLASYTVVGALGGATYVADAAFVGAAKDIGFNDGDISMAKNATTRASHDALACSGDLGCVSCYGLASAGALLMSSATTATCGMFALACPLVVVYGVYTTSQDAVTVYHEGIEGVDPCRLARYDARLRSDSGEAGNSNGLADANPAGMAPARLRLDPQAAARGAWGTSARPDAVAVAHLSGLLVTGMLTALAVQRRLRARAAPERARLLPGLRSSLYKPLGAWAGRRGSAERRVQWASPVALLV